MMSQPLPSRPRSVLVTGAAGRIGRAVCAELAGGGHQVRGVDRCPLPAELGLRDAQVADLVDAAAVARVLDGVEVVVHLAATPDEDDFLGLLLPNNVIALYHVLEGARRAGARRFIVASTGQVVRGHQGPWPITSQSPFSPRNWYGSTKIFAEAAAQAYAFEHGLSCIAIRCGWLPRTAGDEEALERHAFGPDIYFSPGDAGRCFRAAVEAPESLRFAALFATSVPLRRTIYDIEDTRRLLGWEPRDRWPGKGRVAP